MKINYTNKTTETAPLAVFRFLFGLTMLISGIRFWINGWIKDVYINPKWHFSYYGFEFIKPLGEWTYLLFAITIITSIGVAIGYKYRLSSILFFLSFTYIELIDKTTYLNHYYFVSIVSLLLIFLPANASFSVDAFLNKKKAFKKIPRWSIDSIKLIIAIVYIYAGLAKLNSDWLVKALPLKIWLPNKYDLPLIGNFFTYSWTPYLFSWAGALYDLSIPLLLLYKPTRKLAFVAVVLFHSLTYALFPIGIFPLIMTFAVLIFFDADFHLKLIKISTPLFKLKKIEHFQYEKIYSTKKQQFLTSFFILFLFIQLLLPWRYLMYDDELFWTEEGYRFSWRVMLTEKVGTATFKIVDSETKKSFYIQNSDFLSLFQIKQMTTQPDFIIQYAHMLRNHYINEGIKKPEVYVESYVTLNRRLSKPFIDSKINLAKEKDSFAHKTWILPFNETIKGL